MRERLAALGVLAADTHGTAIRLAPPLATSGGDATWGLGGLEEAVSSPMIRNSR